MHTHRGDQDRGSHLGPENRRAQIHRANAPEHARQQLHTLEGGAILFKRRLLAGAGRDVGPGCGVHRFPGKRLVVVYVDGLQSNLPSRYPTLQRQGYRLFERARCPVGERLILDVAEHSAKRRLFALGAEVPISTPSRSSPTLALIRGWIFLSTGLARNPPGRVAGEDREPRPGQKASDPDGASVAR